MGNNGTQSKAYSNSAPYQHSTYPSAHHTLALHTKSVMPEGHAGVVAQLGEQRLTDETSNIEAFGQVCACALTYPTSC